MKKKTRIIVISSVILFFLILYLGFCFAREKYHYLKNNIDLLNEKINVLLSPTKYDYSWIGKNSLVAHALGGVGTNHIAYTNSAEAFKQSYENDFKILEVDLNVTNDLETVCVHNVNDWCLSVGVANIEDFTYNNFINKKIYGKYTPLDYKRLIQMLSIYSDVYIILDSKCISEDKIRMEYSQIVNYAKKIDVSILDRVIPEVYNEEMLKIIMNSYPFKSIVYCLNQSDYVVGEVANICTRYGINLIEASAGRITSEEICYLKNCGFQISIFTINELINAEYYFDQGVDLLYSDKLMPMECNTLKNSN